MRPLVGILLCGGGWAFAQTPPVQPQTPIPKVPAAVALPAFTPAEVLMGQPIRVGEAVEVALLRHRRMAISRYDALAAKGRLDQTRSDLYPQLTVRGARSGTTSLRGGTDSDSASASLTVEQLLFDFGRTRDLVRQQSALVGAANLAVRQTQLEVAHEVRLAFQNHLQDIGLRQVAESNVQNRQRQLDLAQARLDSGLGSPADVVRARGAMADAIVSLTSARQAAIASRVLLASKMGVDPRTPIVASNSVESPLEGTFDELVDRAVEGRPDILEARGIAEAAGLGVSAAGKLNSPRVTAELGVAGRGQTDPLAVQTGTLGVNVQWPLGDGGFAAGRRREAQAQAENARLRFEQTIQDAISEVANAYSAQLSAEQRLATAREQVANAVELVRISEGRYAGEIGTFLELTDAQTALFAAERSRLQAEADVQRARAGLRRATGAL